MPDNAPFKLPANAPKVCPACGGPWTRGYIVKKPDGKKVYKWVLVCANSGCDLGYFAGSEITLAETKGLELIDREKRKQEVVRMAIETNEEKKGPEPEKRLKRPWGGKYESCRECGTTERPHLGRGLCSVCYSRRRKAGTLDQFPPIKSQRKGKRGVRRVASTAKPRGRRARLSAGLNRRLNACPTVELTVRVPEWCHTALETIAAFADSTPEEIAANTLERKLTEAGYSPHGRR